MLLTGALPLPAGAIAGGNGGYADGGPTRLGVSADGRYVAFASDADALSTRGALPDVTNIFRKDRVTGEVVLVSRADGATGAPASRWGTERDDLRRRQPRGVGHVAPRSTRRTPTRRSTSTCATSRAGTTMLATPGITDAPSGYDLSGNGGFVVFETDDGARRRQRHERDARRLPPRARQRRDRARVAQVRHAAGRTGTSFDPAISDDGRWVAFVSEAADVVAGPYTRGGATRNVYARDMTAGAAYLVSNQSGAATTGANGNSREPDIAGAPGAAISSVYVAYNSDATNATTRRAWTRRAPRACTAAGSPDTSSLLVSRATGVRGRERRQPRALGGITDDGARVVFSSRRRQPGAGDDYYGAYVRDVGAGTTALASVDNAYAVQPEISDDGSAHRLDQRQQRDHAGRRPDLDRRLRPRAAAGAPELVSRPPGSAPFLAPATPSEPGGAGARTISADGRYVVFAGYSPRLPGNAAGLRQVYRRDLVTGALELVSRATGADGAPGDRHERRADDQRRRHARRVPVLRAARPGRHRRPRRRLRARPRGGDDDARLARRRRRAARSRTRPRACRASRPAGATSRS